MTAATGDLRELLPLEAALLSLEPEVLSASRAFRFLGSEVSEPAVGKRFYEFVGKRGAPSKRFYEFLGKRGKRYAEFLGKRQWPLSGLLTPPLSGHAHNGRLPTRPSHSPAHKRYKEFLG